MNELQWFIDRIGKKVFRPVNDAVYSCITIQDEDHAKKLLKNQTEKNYHYQDERPVEMDKQ